MAIVPIDYHVGYTQILLCQQSFNEDVHAYICEHHKIHTREIFIYLEKKKNIFVVPEYIFPKRYLKKKKKKSSYNLSNIVLDKKYFIDDKLKSGKCFFHYCLNFHYLKYEIAQYG